MSTKVGVIGLGIMGGAMARNMIRNGLEVSGFDTKVEARERLENAGGKSTTTVRALVESVDIILTSLPSIVAFEQVMSQIADIGVSKRTVIEVSTMPLAAKRAAHRQLHGAGFELLDCPVSGTGAQATKQDLVVFGSGEEASWEEAHDVIRAISRNQFFLGAFGNGTIMKFLANHLVAVHNAAAAEAFALANKAGMDLQTVFETLQDSAATSRMYQIRGPLMIEGKYDEPTTRISMFMKDLQIIGEFASEIQCPTPLFSVTWQLYTAAHNAGYANEDTAAIEKVFENLAGITR
ncbi:2-hydroxy-3-oxopropionate reductase OS=Castellaniella defragrans OX=75697 GN=HNR28_003377 PE=3 SV=1 [Castellaniella defragrans]